MFGLLNILKLLGVFSFFELKKCFILHRLKMKNGNGEVTPKNVKNTHITIAIGKIYINLSFQFSIKLDPFIKAVGEIVQNV